MISDKQHTKLSKFLSLILRHKPETIGLMLDENGWASAGELITKMTSYGKTIDRPTLEYIVANNSKKRFIFSHDGSKIRANQGHSLNVDLAYHPVPAAKVPNILYHGTASRFVDAIYATGAIEKMNRHHVHLSCDIETAKSVGARHGKLVIYSIDTQAMLETGFEFYLADNDVWLTDRVPVQFIKSFPAEY